MRRRLRKILLILVSGLLILAILAAGLGVWLVRRPWPQVSGTLAVSRLSAQTQIIRDKWGVPHIYAQNEPDLFFAQGYVHAQDRLWQMEFNRNLGSGQLSLLFGEDAVEIDRHARTLGARRAAQGEWESLETHTRMILESYTQGINAYLETHRDRLPLEYTLLGVSPAPWSPVDTLVLGRMLARNLSWNAPLELLRERVIAQLGEKTAAQIMPPYGNGSLLLPGEVSTQASPVNFDAVLDLIPFPDGSYQKQGSNNWVVHGSRTATGLPLLANDTHLSFSMPSIWYENGLHGGGFDSVGFTLAGIPLNIIGHNSRIGWGITDLPADVEDIYLEKLNDTQHPTQYEFEGEWHDLEIIEEKIEVKDSTSVTTAVFLTQHGPLLSRNVYKQPEAPLVPMALQTMVSRGKSFEALIQVNLASNWNEFRQALRLWESPSEHFVYADVDGNIGYQAAGKFPRRSSQHQGLMPVPGWTGNYEWQGFYDFDQAYSVFNPPSGYFATANDPALPSDYTDPHIYGLDWSNDNRVEFINEVLAASDQATLEDMRRLQASTYSVAAEVFRPYLLAVKPQDDVQMRALAQVEAWDLNFEIDRVGATIYHVWYWFLLQNTFRDELKEGLIDTYRQMDWLAMPLMYELVPQSQSAWFDDTTTSQVETRDDMILRSLVDAVSWLRERYGDAPETWTWGRFHTVTFVHQPMGDSGISVVESLFNSRTFPARGGEYTVNQAYFVSGDSFKVDGGSAQRFILDLSNWDQSLAVNSTGQSGHALHPHRDDMIEMWESMNYHPMLFTRAAVEANAESTLTLIPQ